MYVISGIFCRANACVCGKNAFPSRPLAANRQICKRSGRFVGKPKVCQRSESASLTAFLNSQWSLRCAHKFACGSPLLIGLKGSLLDSATTAGSCPAKSLLFPEGKRGARRPPPVAETGRSKPSKARRTANELASVGGREAAGAPRTRSEAESAGAEHRAAVRRGRCEDAGRLCRTVERCQRS